MLCMCVHGLDKPRYFHRQAHVRLAVLRGVGAVDSALLCVSCDLAAGLLWLQQCLFSLQEFRHHAQTGSDSSYKMSNPVCPP